MKQKQNRSAIDLINQLFETLLRSKFVELFGDWSEDLRYDRHLLSDVCTKIVDCPHSTPKYSDEVTQYPTIRTTDISNGTIVWNQMKYVDKEQYEERIRRLKPRNGDIVYGREGTIGEAAVLPEGYNFCLGQRVMLFRPDVRIIDPFFLCYVLHSSYTRKMVNAKNTGSTVAHINVRDVLNLPIQLPPMKEQTVFVNIIKQVEKIKRLLIQLISKFEELSKSRFIEMFGDCKETIPIGRVCSLHSRIGWQALTKAEHMATGEYMLITGTDFKDGAIDYTGCKYVSKDRYEMDPNIIIQNGDVLVTKDGTIGKVAVVKDLPKPATLNAGVFVVRNTDNQFLTEFIQQCLLSSDFQRFIESVKRGATIVHLNQEKFLKYELPVADLALQHQFVDFVQQVDKSKFGIIEMAHKIIVSSQSL